MAKFKVTVQTSDLTNVTVSDETTGQTLPPMAPPNTNVVAVVEIVQDTAFGGCWWVHQATINEWWGWQGVCPPQPEIVVRIDGQGSIKDVRLDGQKLKNNVGAPAQPSVRQSSPSRRILGSRPLRAATSWSVGKPIGSANFLRLAERPTRR
jgi:hypothetical protein